MITKEQAMTLRGEVWHITAKNKDGTPLRARVNGKCQTWKTRPEAWKLPMKHGLRDCFYLTEANALAWATPAMWPAESELFRGVTA